MIDLLVSLISLTSLIIFLLEARTGGGFRRRWPAVLWAVFLFLLSVVTLLRVVHNADRWSEGQILMVIIAGPNELPRSSIPSEARAAAARLRIGPLVYLRATLTSPTPQSTSTRACPLPLFQST